MSKVNKSMKSGKQPIYNEQSPTPRASVLSNNTGVDNMILGKENIKWMLIGIGVCVLGYILMISGAPEDQKVFDESLIYSFRVITLAPIIIIIGLCIQFFAILKKF